MSSRRKFLSNTLTAGLVLPVASCSVGEDKKQADVYEESELLIKFRQILKQKVFQSSLINQKVIIDSLEVLKSGKHYFVRVRSKDGAQGVAVANKKYAINIYPIILNRIRPIVKGENATDLDALIDKIYLEKLNYKWQGLAFWVGVAYVELAILDMLGKIAGLPVGALLGGRVRNQVSIYYASGNRGNSASKEVDYLKSLIEKSGAKAVKYRLGARMAHNSDSDKRDRELIPLVREELGDEATIYADANGSYDVPKAIETGKILEDYKVDFFEEPCPFDHYEETKAVSDALKIPIAGGEEESSMRQFMWFMDKNCLQLVQPDLLFFGGLTRSIKVARMAELAGINCTPHISGSGMGFLYMMHFASCVPNIGPYQEFKGNKDKVPVISDTSLQPSNGIIQIPASSGLGVSYEPGFLESGKPIC